MKKYEVMGRDIESYESVEKWMFKLKVQSADPSSFGESSTKRSAIYFLKRFCEETAGMTPDHLIEQRRKQLKSEKERIRRQHEELVEQFNLDMSEEWSANTRQTATAYIRSFYKHNYASLTDITVPKGYPTRQDKVPNVEELARICAHADNRTKAWILCQAESGLSNKDLLSLTLDTESPEYGTIQEQLQSGRTPLHIQKVREKTAAAGLGYFDTFLGVNAVQALNEYLDYSSQKIFPFTARTFQRRVKKIALQADVGSEEVSVHPHALRKFFNTYMRLAGVNELIIEYWMGHSLGSVKGAYWVPPVEEQVKIYQQAYPDINIKGVEID